MKIQQERGKRCNKRDRRETIRKEIHRCMLFPTSWFSLNRYQFPMGEWRPTYHIDKASIRNSEVSRGTGGGVGKAILGIQPRTHPTLPSPPHTKIRRPRGQKSYPRHKRRRTGDNDGCTANIFELLENLLRAAAEVQIEDLLRGEHLRELVAEDLTHLISASSVHKHQQWFPINALVKYEAKAPRRARQQYRSRRTPWIGTPSGVSSCWPLLSLRRFEDRSVTSSLRLSPWTATDHLAPKSSYSGT